MVYIDWVHPVFWSVHAKAYSCRKEDGGGWQWQVCDLANCKADAQLATHREKPNFANLYGTYREYTKAC